MKKYFILVLTCITLLTSTITVHAENFISDEWYELQEEKIDFEEEELSEISPYTKYLMNVYTLLENRGSGKVGIRADVYCTTAVKTINITFRLQKKSGSSWVTVGTGSATDSNVSSTGKSVTASGVKPGTYRAQATAQVIDKNGYTEQLTSTTSSLVID